MHTTKCEQPNRLVGLNQYVDVRFFRLLATGVGAELPHRVGFQT